MRRQVPRVLEQWACLDDSLLTDQPVAQLAQAVFSVVFADRSVHLIRRGSLAAIVEYGQLVSGVVMRLQPHPDVQCWSLREE
ncbi:hypothetical protein AK812_SmicGene47233 [Symbiodinium microadriaticum]|uniref:Uncharacterized protein n=1 Tax=Symbiodinium microadriaticum TaxID=2951 RepID=A0A1Q9BS43_SYMMI|nr:hypothetical protein AK812_SmicGene47233 [Symbiodinium microadriaticum]